MERAFRIGCHVVFFDSHRQPHDALVTNWFHGGDDGQTVKEYLEKHEKQQATNSPENRSPPYIPCCNLLYVSDTTSKEDPYGRQTERQSSCSYGNTRSPQYLGVCWCWPDEAVEVEQLIKANYEQSQKK